MGTVAKVNGAWFAYGPRRVYGPFKHEREAWRALREAAQEDGK